MTSTTGKHGRDAGHPALPVVLVAGLHADARAAAVGRLLRDVPGSVALHYDLGAAGPLGVPRRLRDATGERSDGEAPLLRGCACCALRDDLVPRLERLADEGASLAVVELWDSVEPRPMAELLARTADEGLRLAGVVTAVDPALVMPYLACADSLAEAGFAAAPTDQRMVADTWARQVEYAPVLACAAGPEPASAADHAVLAQLQPFARQIDVTGPGFAAAATGGFDAEAAAARQHPATVLLPPPACWAGVTTVVWRHRRPFHPGRLYDALEELACAAPRSRGRFWLADRPGSLLSWDAAGGAVCVDNAGPWLAALPDAAWDLMPPVRRAAAAMDWDPGYGDRSQLLAFTGPGLDAARLCEVLSSCLLTEAECAAGLETWRGVGSAFDELLAPAF